ncbi:MAG: hypothetical protein H6739_15165 [Alphaproteobacteria bacterium]|nr:hypothetical protein [Alphaproteobacteria bacterium]
MSHPREQHPSHNERMLTTLEHIAGTLSRIADALEGLDVVERPADPEEAPANDPARADATTSEDGGDPERLEALRAFLSSRGVRIKAERAPDPADPILDRLAVLMGRRYPDIQPFYTTLKRNLNDGRRFTLNMKKAPQRTLSTTCQFASRLHEVAFLEDYHYQRAPRCLLHATPNRIPRAINFLTGGWLERYAVREVIDTLQALRPGVPFAWLKNPQVVLPNGDDFELDVLFEIDGQVLWLELKTGDYQRHIAKYARVSRLLGLDVSQSFMVLTGIQADAAAELSALFHMTVTPIDALGETLEGVLGTAG